MNNGIILLVEDNPDDEALTLRALKKNKILNPVVVVRDGAEALDYLFSNGAYVGRLAAELPIVVLLDLKLPKVDGLEVLRRLRSDFRTRTLPVVAFTSSSEAQDIEQSYRLGINSYVRKPVNFEQFVSAVGLMGSYWIAVNQPPQPVQN